jgi:hypothetical protein
MKIPKHTERSLEILARVAGWGFPPEAQQLLARER